MIISD